MGDMTIASPADTALIVGCGYLGRVLARELIDEGVRVYGTTRSTQHAERLFAMGVRPMLLQVTQPVTYASLRPALESASLDVYYLVPPGRSDAGPTPRQVILGGIAHMVKALRRAHVRKAILTSSTAVYGQAGNDAVTADTAAAPTHERAQLLAQGEQLWLDAGPAYHVVRLAGLYGPGRVIGRDMLLQAAPLVGDPQAWLNLIHVDDAADLLYDVISSPQAGRIELGCDDHPSPRIDYYRRLAAMIGAPEPIVLDDATAAATFGLDIRRLRQSANKRCDNGPTCARTGWRPRFASYREGLEHALA